eukprot:7131527-Pyramimonas_sp.AAC.2
MDTLMQKAAHGNSAKRLRAIRENAQSSFERVLAQTQPAGSTPPVGVPGHCLDPSARRRAAATR